MCLLHESLAGHGVALSSFEISMIIPGCPVKLWRQRLKGSRDLVVQYALTLVYWPMKLCDSLCFCRQSSTNIRYNIFFSSDIYYIKAYVFEQSDFYLQSVNCKNIHLITLQFMSDILTCSNKILLLKLCDTFRICLHIP